MYHFIKFTRDSRLDVEAPGKRHLERLLIPAGTGMHAQLKPYVVETVLGPVEVADLFFTDGTASRAVPFGCFTFAE
jgi:hypothetical protein